MLKLKSVNFEQQEFGSHTLVQSHPEQLEWVIGRYATCDLVLSSQEVSRVHGRIFYQDGTYYFIDDGSTSGSSLNGEPIGANDKRSLHVGDLLQVGETYLHIEVLEPPSLAKPEAAPVLQAAVPSAPESQWTAGDLAVRCCRIIDETPDVKTFCFMADPPVMFNYKPGQFVNLEVEIDGKSVIRPYSISSSPTRPYYLTVTVKRERGDRPDMPPGLVSNWMHQSLKINDRAKIVGNPLGHFTCLPELPSKILLIGAGSGITPIMSMARWIQDTMVGCDVVFLYSARTPEDIIFRDELAAMSAQMPNFHLAVTVTQPTSGQAWMGLTGRVSKPMLHLVAPDLLDRSVYVCGPNGFVQAIRSTLESLNFPMQRYKQESFGGKPAAAPATAQTSAAQTPKAAPSSAALSNKNLTQARAAAASARAAVSNGKGTSSAVASSAVKTAPLVKFAKSDRTVPVDGNTSVLELAEQEGISIRNACRAGSCGACKVSAQGQVQYNGQPLALTEADQQGGYILACIARPVDRLIVDA